MTIEIGGFQGNYRAAPSYRLPNWQKANVPGRGFRFSSRLRSPPINDLGAL